MQGHQDAMTAIFAREAPTGLELVAVCLRHHVGDQDVTRPPKSVHWLLYPSMYAADQGNQQELYRLQKKAMSKGYPYVVSNVPKMSELTGIRV